MKKPEKKYSNAPEKNVELTDRWSERQTDNRDFIGPSAGTGTNIQRKLDHILFSGYIADHFEVLGSFSAKPDQIQPICFSDISFLRY